MPVTPKCRVDTALPIEFSEVCEVLYKDITASTNGRSLNQAFIDANLTLTTRPFDPAYASPGNKDRLQNFRGYPLPPPTPTITCSSTASSYSLTINVSTAGTGGTYNVYLGANSAPAQLYSTGNPDAPTIVITGLVQATPYNVRVSYVIGGCEGDKSSSIFCNTMEVWKYYGTSLSYNNSLDACQAYYGGNNNFPYFKEANSINGVEDSTIVAGDMVYTNIDLNPVNPPPQGWVTMKWSGASFASVIPMVFSGYEVTSVAQQC